MELANYVYIVAAVAGWFVAQAIKFTLSLRQDGISTDDLFTSGGMPSSHSSFVASVTMTVGLSEGFESAVFAVSLVLLGVVVYDSVGVRRATGENTKILRDILKQMKIKKHGVALHLALGHTPYQVLVGVITGSLTGLAVHTIIG